MNNIILFSITLFFSISIFAGENTSMNVEVYASSVFKGSEEGTRVPDPIDNSNFKILNDDYIYFSLDIENESKNSFVITTLQARVVDKSNNELGVFVYAPQVYSHCSLNYPEQPVGGSYFSHLNHGDRVTIGNYKNSLFYIDNLKEDEITGNYELSIEVTVNGYYTSVSRSMVRSESCEPRDHKVPVTNPSEGMILPFKRILYFKVYN